MTSSSPHLRCHELRRTAALRQRTRSNIDTSLLDLPDEIIELILSKCPVKSAIRFKSVSKSWLSIISYPRFFRILQSKLSENQKNKFIIWAKPPSKDYGLYLIRLEDGEFQIESELGTPFGRPICSCDGLILLRCQILDKYMLWNPLIRKHIIIPAFNPKTHPHAFANWQPHTYTYPHHRLLYHDSITDDYKIVFFYRKCYAVYSCKNGSWEEIKDLPRDWDLDRIQYGRAGIDACLYDICYDNTEIICFDARDGKLHKFPQPEGVKCLVKVQLRAVSGRLCLYGFSDYDLEMLQLWVMEENGSFEKSWRKLISMKKAQPFIRCLIPICLSYDDDVVLWSLAAPKYGKNKHFIYNSRRNCNVQESLDFTWNENFYQYFPYSENLDMPSSNIC